MSGVGPHALSVASGIGRAWVIPGPGRRVDEVQNSCLEGVGRDQAERDRRLPLVEESEAGPGSDRVHEPAEWPWSSGTSRSSCGSGRRAALRSRRRTAARVHGPGQPDHQEGRAAHRRPAVRAHQPPRGDDPDRPGFLRRLAAGLHADPARPSSGRRRRPAASAARYGSASSVLPPGSSSSRWPRSCQIEHSDCRGRRSARISSARDSVRCGPARSTWCSPPCPSEAPARLT